jgi:hypothetical protein
MRDQIKLLLVITVASALASCGEGIETSQTKDVTDPFDQIIGTAREFWFFESQEDGLGNSEKGQVNELNYFPLEMPIGQEDFFWTGSDSLLNDNNVTFSSSALRSIQRSVPVLAKVDLSNGSFLNLHLYSESLNNQIEEPRWFAEFEPTFITKNTTAQTLGSASVEASIELVCYRLESENLFIIPVESKLILALKEDQTKQVAPGQVIFNPKLKISNETVDSFVRSCRTQGGELSSVFQAKLNGTAKGPFALEFTGLKTNLVNYSITNN